MNDTSLKFLLFVTKPYSFPVLEPIEKKIYELNFGTVKWFVSKKVGDYQSQSKVLNNSAEVLEYSPDAIIVPGNVVPHFWPGLKVQVFHGLDDEVKGFYKITGFFDLYCTPGPDMTNKFMQLSKKYGHFFVKETGWPKLDGLKTDKADSNRKRNKFIMKHNLDIKKKNLLYAPTFPPKYSSAWDLYNQFKFNEEIDFNIIVKFHPMMDRGLLEKYRNISRENYIVIDDNNILPIMQYSDLMITDISSVAYEYLYFNKPIITYKAIARLDKAINITNPSDLLSSIRKAIDGVDTLSEKRENYFNSIHPYRDNNSSERILKWIQNVINQKLFLKLSKKPLNIIRKCQIKSFISKIEKS